MYRAQLSALIVTTLVAFTTAASAEPPPAPSQPAATKAKPERPRRRAEKHDQVRSKQERSTRVHVIDTVTVVGRAQRPMSVFDVNVKSFRFPVGTERYSPRDRRFAKPGW
jgi:hypothetical protein